MTQQTQSLRGRKFSGDLMGRAYGTNNGLLKLGNVTEFTTKSETEKDELKSTGREDYGQAIEVEAKGKPIEISLKFNTFDKHALARMLMGEAVDLASSPQAIPETTVRAVKGMIKLNYTDINPEGFALKVGSKVVEATKYKLNPRLGLLEITDWTGIDVGTELKYSGNTKGSAGFSIDANTLQSLELELYLDGQDRITGNNGILEIPHAVLSANGDINWFTEDWWESAFSGTAVKDEGKPVMKFTEFLSE